MEYQNQMSVLGVLTGLVIFGILVMMIIPGGFGAKKSDDPISVTAEATGTHPGCIAILGALVVLVIFAFLLGQK